MNKRFKYITGVLVGAAGLLIISIAPLLPVYAASTDSSVDSICSSINDGGDCDASSSASVANILKTVLNILTFLIGFVAVIMIVISGFKFVLSGGDAGQVKSARTGIIYALVGLAVAALAQVLVYFVINQVNNSGQTAAKKPTAAQCKKNKKLKGC